MIDIIPHYPSFAQLSVKEILSISYLFRKFEPSANMSPAYLPSYYNHDGCLKFSRLNENFVVMHNDIESHESNLSLLVAQRLANQERTYANHRMPTENL